MRGVVTVDDIAWRPSLNLANALLKDNGHVNGIAHEKPPEGGRSARSDSASLLLILRHDAERHAGRTHGHLAVTERDWVALGHGVFDAREVI